MTTTREISESTKYVTETLVTDTRTYEIIKRTARTITIRPMVQGSILDRRENGSGYPQVWHEAVSDPTAPTRTVRLRKDGTYRVSESARALRPAYMIDGKPTEYTDYSF
jgi:hypothetical protein